MTEDKNLNDFNKYESESLKKDGLAGANLDDAERFSTEKILADDDFKRERIKSYSHYSDYGKENVVNHSLDAEEVEEIVKKEVEREVGRKTPSLAKIVVISILAALVTILLFNYFFKGDRPELLDQGQRTVTINPREDISIEAAVNEKAADSVVGITTKALERDNIFNLGGLVEGLGSGVIVSQDGYILTNSHVISDGAAEEIEVVFANKETASAQLLWYEPELDLAVLKVEAQGLTPVEIANSDEIRVGDKAIAIGTPLGLDFQSTLTSGYVSGLDRSITLQNGNTMDGLIQTDAAINGGNSGGALLNSKGQLIGINTAKVQGGEGIGFAIPVNTAQTIVKRIENSDSFEPVVLGIRAVGLDLYQSYTGEDTGLEEGIVVMEVLRGSAAEAAGVEVGDIITALDQEPIGSMGKLRTALLAYSLEDQALLVVYRAGQELELEINFSGGVN